MSKISLHCIGASTITKLVITIAHISIMRNLTISTTYMLVLLNLTKDISHLTMSFSLILKACKIDKNNRSAKLYVSIRMQKKRSYGLTLNIITRRSLCGQDISSSSFNVMGSNKHFFCKLYASVLILRRTSLACLFLALLDSPFRPEPSCIE